MYSATCSHSRVLTPEVYVIIFDSPIPLSESEYVPFCFYSIALQVSGN